MKGILSLRLSKWKGKIEEVCVSERRLQEIWKKKKKKNGLSRKNNESYIKVTPGRGITKELEDSLFWQSFLLILNFVHFLNNQRKKKDLLKVDGSMGHVVRSNEDTVKILKLTLSEKMCLPFLNC